MADLGLGTSSYPTSLDTDPSPETGDDSTNHLPVNGGIDACINIETEIGTNPSQNKSTVKAYLQTEHDADGKHTQALKIPLVFMQDEVAASQNEVFLKASGATPLAVCVPWAGSVVGISVFSNEARTAGTLTVDVFAGGVLTGLQAVLDETNIASHYSSQDTDIDTFPAGDVISCKITTDAGWLPITADIVVVVFVSFN